MTVDNSEDKPSYPTASPLDDDLLRVLNEVCRSYQTFLRDLAKRSRNKATDEHPISLWLLYLLVLSYDVGFICLAIVREGIDRQLLTMKRQAFEFAVKAQYLVMFPEKALQQYYSIPLKQREFLRRLGFSDANSEAARLLAEEEDRLRLVMPDVQPTYGEVSMFDMLRATDPEHHSEHYARQYWLSSATIHGFQLGMLDVVRRLPDGKLWLSQNSMLTTRNENVMVVTDSLIRVLLLTGNQFRLYGTHWVSMTERYNAVVERLAPGGERLDLPIDTSGLHAAARFATAHPTAFNEAQNLRIDFGPYRARGGQVMNSDEQALMAQLLGEPDEAIPALAAYVERAMGEILLKQLPRADALGGNVGGLQFSHLVRLLLALDRLPADLVVCLEALVEMRDGLASDVNWTLTDAAVSKFLEGLPDGVLLEQMRLGTSISDQFYFARALLALEVMRFRHSPRMQREEFFEDILQQVITASRRLPSRSSEPVDE